MDNPFASLRILGAVLKDVSTFESHKPMTVQMPATDTVADLSEFGLGRVRIQQAGEPIIITKLPDVEPAPHGR